MKVPAIAVAALAALGLVAACTSSDADAEADPAKFCEEITAVADAELVFDQLAADQIADTIAAIEEASAAAPPEVADDLDVLARYGRDVLDAFEVTDGQDLESAAKAAFAAQETDPATIEEAGAALETYVRDACGIELQDLTVTEDPAPPTTGSG